jgi:hypothetical protein
MLLPLVMPTCWLSAEVVQVALAAVVEAEQVVTSTPQTSIFQ